MPNQEKLHFVVATDGQVDRFDGTPDYTYLEEIKAYMARVFQGWDQQPDSANWLQMDTPNHSRDFRKKFPFAVERLDQRCFKSKKFEPKQWVQTGVVKRFNTPASDHKTPSGSRSVTSSTRTVRQDPRRTEDELRQAQVKFYLKIYQIRI